MADPTLKGNWTGQNKGEQINLKLQTDGSIGAVEGTYVDVSHGGAGRVGGVHQHPEVHLVGEPLATGHPWYFVGQHDGDTLDGVMEFFGEDPPMKYTFERAK